MSQSERESPLTGAEIAIIGMAGRFPGARDIDAFWANIKGGVESIRSFTPEELDAAAVPESVRADPNFVASGAVADDLDGFDAAFFGVGRREAEIMDPQHRVFLEAAWEALERAGYDPERTRGPIGIFGGVAPNTYRQNILNTRPELLASVGDYLAMICSEREYAITRAAFKLNLRGPSSSVNTACSSSGVALHLACQSLLAGENDLCLVGGARVRAPLTAGYVYLEDGIVSPDGHCRAFDAQARGTAIGNGVGMIVLKRLTDAIADRDWIHAVIKGTAVNNDGSAKVGFTAPSVVGQSEVIAEALALAGVSADSIGYLEAHGTGTALGDPIEIAAATKAFRRSTDGRHFCGVGSLKTNIGHLDAGSGVASVIKCALALEHAQLPPSLNFSQPNPQIDFDSSPFYVVERLLPWERGETPRRAGVSNFGLGGTNVHVILEEAPPRPAASPSRRRQLLLWSAATPAAADQATANLGAYLKGRDDLDLADVAHTLQCGRRRFAHRRALVCSERGEAVEALALADPRRILSEAGSDQPRSVVFMFPGGGAQYVNMGRELYESEPVFRAALDRCLGLVKQQTGTDLFEIFYPGDRAPAATDESERPSLALPMLFSIEFALAQLWTHWGLRPDALIGHSMGEYTAACLAGVVSLGDGLRIVIERGRLFEKLEAGAMLSVQLSEERALELAKSELSIAAINRPSACVLSGPADAIDALQRELEAQEIQCSRIHISVAAHSRMVEPILEEFGAFLRGIDLREPLIPYVSNVTGTWIRAEEARDPQYWVKHLRQSVRFADGLETILSEGARIAIEAGPGQTLSTFARQHPAIAGHAVISSMRHPREVEADDAFLLASLSKAWMAGAEVDWEGFSGAEQRRRVPLPGYPFERVRHWVEPGRVSIDAPRVETRAPSAADTDVAAEPELAQSRKQRILTGLVGIIGELSGLEAQAVNVHATFIELGFDSLLLTQANAAIQRRFSVRITFRQLFAEAPTLDRLADFIDAALPQADQVEPASASTPRTNTAPASSQPVTTPAGAGGHGPWKPHETAQEGFSDAQRRGLDALIERFTARTRRSKQLAQTHRAHLADPRTAAGFRLAWKELVYPIVADRASGSKLWDVDGNEWLDVTMGFGVTLLGHSPDFITRAVAQQLARSIAIGPQSSLAGEVAGLVCELTGHERAAFCNTGSEAVLAAIRSARTVSGRDRIVVFGGAYHGIFDEVIVKKVGTGAEARSLPVAPGIPRGAVEQVLVLDYGDPAALEIIEANAHTIAAVLVEPIQSRNPELQPAQFVRALRRVTAERDIALVFDEMVTGFRVHVGGAQAFYGVRADMATYGKVIGGGLPIGVVAGRAKYLDALDGGHWQFGDDSVPEVGVTWFAGTFVRHPLALAAARAALLHFKQEGPQLQDGLNRRTAGFRDAANELFRAGDFPIRIVGFASLFNFRFEEGCEYASLYFHYLRDRHIHCHERRPHFLTTAHSPQDIDALLKALQGAAEDMRADGFLPSPKPAASIPLTEAQLELWLASCLDEDASRAFHLSAAIDLEGELDRGALERALRDLALRHDALRVTIEPEEESQRVAPEADVALEEIDLSGADEAQQAAELQRFGERDSQRLFDLQAGPLVRFTLIALGPRRRRLVITAHHIVCDGWSLGILTRDLGALYAAAVSGRPATLPAAPMQLGDYAREQIRRQAGDSGATAEAYWMGHFQDEVPTLDLPTDRERPAFKTYRAGQATLACDAAFLSAVKEYSARNGATTFATLVAAYSLFLKRLSSADDVVVGVATAGQPAAGSKDLVGHCVNLYPLRSRARREQDFTHHLAEIQGSLVDSLDYADCTYGRLVSKLEGVRDPSRLPLMSSMVTYETETIGLGFGDLGMKVANNPKRFCNFDIELYLTESRAGLRLEFHYNTDLFDSSTVERWLADLRVLLSSILAGHSGPAAELAMQCEEERALLETCNATAAEYPTRACVQHAFERHAAQSPRATALICPPTPERPALELSYGELNCSANRLARHLRGRGVAEGDLVAVCLRRSPELLVGLLAVLKAGAAYVPLDPDHPSERLEYMLTDCGAKLLVCEEALAAALDPEGIEVCCLGSVAADLAQQDPGDLGLSPSSENLAYVIYTTGSTGRPKGVEIPHRAVVNFLCSMARAPGFSARDRILAVTTVSFDIAALELLLPLSVGGSLVLADETDVYDGRRLAELIDSHGVTVMQATPATWQLMLEAGWQGSQALKVLCGGEALPLELARALSGKCESFWNMYGPTETTIWSAIARIPPGAERVTIGRPIANTQLRIVDEGGRSAPLGAPGELWVGGAGLARGYLGRSDLTAERFVDADFEAGEPARFYRTGDLARWLPSGELEYKGRGDDQIKLRGFRIEPGEIEFVLDQFPDLSASAVALRGNQPGGERLVAYVVAREGATLDVDALRDHLRRKLPEYMLPGAFVQLDSLPLTPNRKLDRKALPAPEAEQMVLAHAYVAPRTRTETRMAELWAEILGAAKVGLEDDFFALGGYSLVAARLIARLNTEFGVQVSLRNLFEAPTVAGLSEIVEALRWAEQGQVVSTDRGERVELDI